MDTGGGDNGSPRWGQAILVAALAGIVTVLVQIGLELRTQTSVLQSMARQQVVQASKPAVDKAVQAAADTSAKALASSGLEEEDARRIGATFARSLVDELLTNPASDGMRKLFLPPSGEDRRGNDAETDRLAGEEVRKLLTRAAGTALPAGVAASATQAIASLGTGTLLEVRNGFLAALGATPVELAREGLSGLAGLLFRSLGSAEPPSIQVSCCSCQAGSGQGGDPPDKKKENGKKEDDRKKEVDKRGGDGKGGGPPAAACPPVERMAFDVFFDDDEPAGWRLDAQRRDDVRRIVDRIRKLKHPTILVRAWTDTTASHIAGHNEKLAQRRATAVRDAIVAEGVSPRVVLMAPLATTEPPDGSVPKGRPNRLDRVVTIEVQDWPEVTAPRR